MREREREREIDGIALKYALDYLSIRFDQTIILTKFVFNAEGVIGHLITYPFTWKAHVLVYI